jgi:hypothetical protein
MFEYARGVLNSRKLCLDNCIAIDTKEQSAELQQAIAILEREGKE